MSEGSSRESSRPIREVAGASPAPRSYRKQVECRNGWILLQRRTHGLMLCRCGWKSKRVPLGKDPQAYSAKLDAVTKDHERKAAHVPLAV